MFRDIGHLSIFLGNTLKSKYTLPIGLVVLIIAGIFIASKKSKNKTGFNNKEFQ